MPSPRSALLLLPVAVGGLVLGGCAVGDDGPSTAQTRHVPAFTRVDDNGAIDVRIHVGEPQHVRVRAGRKVIDDVHTEVHDGTLELDFDHHGWGGSDVEVEASVPKLTGVRADGSGDIDVDGIDADAFELRSDGSADVSLAGSAGRLSVEMNGSGDGDLADLQAREAHVSVAGSGDAEVRADERLDVAVDGSGDVRYHGDPQLTQDVSGSGDLSHVG